MNIAPPRAIVQRLFNHPEAVAGIACSHWVHPGLFARMASVKHNVYGAATSQRSTMKLKNAFAILIPFFAIGLAFAQDLGPQIRKLEDGVYVYVGKNFNSNCGIVLTREGVVLIDTEPHPVHTTGHFVFSPPAAIIAAEGAGDSMRSRERGDPERIQKLAAASPDMRAALDGYRFVTPHVEYHQKTALKVGERTFELMYLKGVHSESDTAVWLPKERVLFSAAGIVVNQINNLRPIVSIPDILAAAKTMKSLSPVHVVPGHGMPGTVKIFEDSEKYYALLLERVGRLAKEGKSLDQIKKEVRMPEYENWAAQERFPTNVEAAYRAVKGG